MDLYHVFNRGVDKRAIFENDHNRVRFIHNMWEFNDILFVDNVRHRVPKVTPLPSSENTDLRSPYLGKERIVDIHGWCLMGNHYHLLLSERVEGGMTQFLRRLNIGYAKYFNEQNVREGTLFQGRTKKILIKTDAHFLHILHYIHLNPLDFTMHSKDWRSGTANVTKALEHLEKYRWSSYKDYCGEKNFGSILTTELFGDVFGNYKKRLKSYVRDMETEVFVQYRLE